MNFLCRELISIVKTDAVVKEKARFKFRRIFYKLGYKRQSILKHNKVETNLGKKQRTPSEINFNPNDKRERVIPYIGILIETLSVNDYLNSDY